MTTNRTATRFRRLVLPAGLFALALGIGQAAPPRLGYVYPAGGQQGTSVELELGGQYLGDPESAIVSGEGVTLEVVEHRRLPSAQVISDYRDRLRSVRGELRSLQDETRGAPEAEIIPRIEAILESVELDARMIRQVERYTRQRNDPKRQLNNQIAESVIVRATLAPGAEPGVRYLRLRTADGLSNPVRFEVGRLPEYREPPVAKFSLANYLGFEVAPPSGEADPDLARETRGPVALPATLNGQILPGEVDEFTFTAEEGDQVVVSLHARSLVPFLADAVPGWFQAVVSLADTRGRELAYADDYRFDPDPVLFYRIPRTGEYRLRLHDAIYRGREDFVYRVVIGELPFLTGISPIGGRAGAEVDLKFQGGNLSERERPGFPLPEQAGILDLSARGAEGLSNTIAFHVGDLPEDREREGNDRLGAANSLEVPGIVNGSIGRPGDLDFYRIKGTGNQPMTFEVLARRLGSPVDSNLAIYDDDGKQIAWNDDFENPAAGLTTHHADARVTVTLPANGLCFVRVADTQNRGGYTHAYRLKVTQGAPDVALRATPSSVNARAGGGASVTVHALRLDGFQGPIQVELVDPPKGVRLKNDTIPAGEESARLGLEIPARPTDSPLELSLRGRVAWEGGDPVTVEVLPAEGMTQAFILKHLVPVDRLLLDVRPALEPDDR